MCMYLLWSRFSCLAVARFTKRFHHPSKGEEFHTLHSVWNSAPLCIFLTLLYQSQENCSTNMQLKFTQTFCKPPCDWLINRGWGKFLTLWHIPPPTEPEECSAPFGGAESSRYRACWKCFLKQKIHHPLGPKGDETNSAGYIVIFSSVLNLSCLVNEE